MNNKVFSSSHHNIKYMKESCVYHGCEAVYFPVWSKPLSSSLRSSLIQWLVLLLLSL